jgi:hypothetical protein
LDRGHYASAAAAEKSVPTAFVYNSQLAPTSSSNAGDVNLYGHNLPANFGSGTCAEWNVSDREGTNGLDFVSASDPRLVLDSKLTVTCDGTRTPPLPDSVFYYPSKFGDPAATGLIPLATGVEARLVEAEAALKVNNDVATWAGDLNALRAGAPSTYLLLASGMNPLTADSTTTAGAAERVDVMFRERAFWLFGTGTRLGDLRRLIRQYQRDQSTVFPIGPYPNGHDSHLPLPLPNYGADVNLTLPTPISHTPVTNPYYKGCITSTRTA